jgi:hypothetical protein
MASCRPIGISGLPIDGRIVLVVVRSKSVSIRSSGVMHSRDDLLNEDEQYLTTGQSTRDRPVYRAPREFMSWPTSYKLPTPSVVPLSSEDEIGLACGLPQS